MLYKLPNIYEHMKLHDYNTDHSNIYLSTRQTQMLSMQCASWRESGLSPLATVDNPPTHVISGTLTDWGTSAAVHVVT